MDNNNKLCHMYNEMLIATALYKKSLDEYATEMLLVLSTNRKNKIVLKRANLKYRCLRYLGYRLCELEKNVKIAKYNAKIVKKVIT